MKNPFKGCYHLYKTYKVEKDKKKQIIVYYKECVYCGKQKVVEVGNPKEGK